jgi:hypothetical protein
MLDPATRSRIATAAGRTGGLRNVAKNGAAGVSAPARRGFMRRFELQVDPEGRLSPEERASRARFAMKAHMAELNLRSLQSRARREERT